MTKEILHLAYFMKTETRYMGHLITIIELKRPATLRRQISRDITCTT